MKVRLNILEMFGLTKMKFFLICPQYPAGGWTLLPPGGQFVSEQEKGNFRTTIRP